MIAQSTELPNEFSVHLDTVSAHLTTLTTVGGVIQFPKEELMNWILVNLSDRIEGINPDMLKEIHVTKNRVELIYPNGDVRDYGLSDSGAKNKISVEELRKLQGQFNINLA